MSEEKEKDSFQVKTADEFKEVEEVKVKVWAVKVLLSVLSYGLVGLFAAILYHAYMNPTNDNILNKTINSIFNAIEYIFKGL